jgi:hypothetical protein
MQHMYNVHTYRRVKTILGAEALYNHNGIINLIKANLLLY